VADEFDRIAALIDEGQLDAARDALRASASEPWTAVLWVKLGFREGGLTVEAAMQRLVQLMHADPLARGVRELYAQISGRSFRDHVSSLSHSHPCLPAVRLPDDPKE